MDLESARDNLARALQKAVEEHGVPNSFSPGELATLYGGPSATMAGRIGRHFLHSLERQLAALDEALNRANVPRFKGASPEPIDYTQLDPEPGRYYASCRDGDRTGLLIGPFVYHAQALLAVPAARRAAQVANSLAAFYSFGTLRMEDGFDRPGVINDLVPGRRSMAKGHSK